MVDRGGDCIVDRGDCMVEGGLHGGWGGGLHGG